MKDFKSAMHIITYLSIYNSFTITKKYKSMNKRELAFWNVAMWQHCDYFYKLQIRRKIFGTKRGAKRSTQTVSCSVRQEYKVAFIPA